MARMRIAGGIALGSCLVLVQVAVAQDVPDSHVQERAEVRMREARLRIQPRHVAPPGACLDLGLDDLRVRVRGEDVGRELLLELEREPRPTLHAVLVDTSQSADGRLDYFRAAAAEYLTSLRPGRDSGLVVSFDESVILVQPQTGDVERLVEAVQSVRMGAATALNDGLYFVLRELEAHRERPVILLITDGFDTASMHSRTEVNALAELRPDQTIFTIGVGVPPIVSRGPPGLNSTKRFLQRLAGRTNGKYFDVHTGSRLAGAFAEIREMLDNEALLTLLDPDTGAEPGRIEVRSRNPHCKVKTFREAKRQPPDSRLEPVRPPYPDPPRSFPLPVMPAYRKYYRPDGKGGMDPDCTPRSADDPEGALWFIDVLPEVMRGCALDITMETGLLYSVDNSSRMRFNAWLKQKTRPFEIPVPEFRRLPTRVEQIMPALSDQALGVAGFPVETDPRQLPVDEHARPYHDFDMLGHGKTFFDVRPSLARALFTYPDYRAWVREQLRKEERAELQALRERFRRHAPDSSEDALDEAMRLSRQAQEIRDRAEFPSDVDLQEYLSSWLGDISAHDLFVRWEMEWIDDRLSTRNGEPMFETFRERWEQTRRVLLAPSYARVLTLLAPVFDPERERVGFWRVVLQRPGWAGRRVKGYRDRSDYSDLPLDLVPDLPLALWVVDRIAAEQPERVEALRRGHRVHSVRYSLLGKPWRHDLRRGFRDTRLEIEFVSSDTAEIVCWTADLRVENGQPRLEHFGAGP